MSILAGAGFGAAQALQSEQERKLREFQVKEQARIAQEEMARRVAEDAAQQDLQLKQLNLADLRRRDDNNARGIDLMRADKQQMDTDTALAGLPPHMKQLTGLMRIGAIGKLSPADLQTPEQREAAERAEEERQIRIRRASVAPQRRGTHVVGGHLVDDDGTVLFSDPNKKAGDGTPSPYGAERATRTLQSVDELMGKVNRWTTGIGSMTAMIPETNARNFKAELDTLKANIVFNELTAMREASKTGGALGAVSDKEMQLLSSALGALDAGQSPDNIRKQLAKIKESVRRWQVASGQSSTTSNGDATPSEAETPFQRYLRQRGGG